MPAQSLLVPAAHVCVEIRLLVEHRPVMVCFGQSAPAREPSQNRARKPTRHAETAALDGMRRVVIRSALASELTGRTGEWSGCRILLHELCSARQ
jgi:hypothetical protein